MKVPRRQLNIHVGTLFIVAKDEVEDIAVVLLATVLLLLHENCKTRKLGQHGMQHWQTEFVGMWHI